MSATGLCSACGGPEAGRLAGGRRLAVDGTGGHAPQFRWPVCAGFGPSRGEPGGRALVRVHQPAQDDCEGPRLRAWRVLHLVQASGAGPVRLAAGIGPGTGGAVADRACGTSGVDRHHRPAPPQAPVRPDGGGLKPPCSDPCRVGRHRVVGEQRPPPPRRQPVDPAGRVAVDAQQRVGQPGAGIDVLHPAGCEQAVDDPGVLRAQFASGVSVAGECSSMTPK